MEPSERQRFLQYCKQQVSSAKAIISQLESMPGMIPQVIQREKQKAAAYAIVAMDLESVSDDSIG